MGESEFISYLINKKSVIVQKWLDGIVDCYSPTTASFMKAKKDPFLNPVGHALSSLIDGIFSYLTNRCSYGDIKPVLVDAIKILVVQDMPSSRGLGFINMVKKVVRAELKKEIKKENLFSELLVFESKVDEVLLKAVDIYIANIAKLYEIKANDIKNRTFKLLRMANLEDEARSLMMDSTCKSGQL